MLEKMETAEAGEDLDTRMGTQKERAWAPSFFPGSQMALDQNPGTCFLWRPTSWIFMVFSSLYSWAWPLPQLVPIVPCTRARGQKGAGILPSLYSPSHMPGMGCTHPDRAPFANLHKGTTWTSMALQFGISAWPEFTLRPA